MTITALFVAYHSKLQLREQQFFIPRFSWVAVQLQKFYTLHWTQVWQLRFWRAKFWLLLFWFIQPPGLLDFQCFMLNLKSIKYNWKDWALFNAKVQNLSENGVSTTVTKIKRLTLPESGEMEYEAVRKTSYIQKCEVDSQIKKYMYREKRQDILHTIRLTSLSF